MEGRKWIVGGLPAMSAHAGQAGKWVGSQCIIHKVVSSF